jgi:two-component system cell cycle response regulator CtrA
MRVLLVEDDIPTARSLEVMLRSENFDVFWTDLGEEAIDLGKLHDYGVILLDLGLPDMSGHDVLQSWRKAGVKTPVIILTALSGVEDKVAGLGYGADGYMTKPFHKDELVARMHAAVRSFRGHDARVVTGELVVDLRQKTAEIGGVPLQLTDREFRALALLCQRKGTTLTPPMLFNHCYGGWDGSGLPVIDQLVDTLRQKLARASHGVNFIHSVWDMGYVLRAPSATAS